MILLPNLAIFFFALWRSLKDKAFFLVGTAALLDVIVPYCQKIIFDRCNGINAPGTREWTAWTVATISANQGAIVLLLVLASLILVRKR